MEKREGTKTTQEKEEELEDSQLQAGDGGDPQGQLQVVAFSTRGELGARASELQLMRTPLADLQPGDVLSYSYAGGKVVSTFSGQLTQGSVVVLLQDYGRYVQCVVSGDATRLLPSSAALDSGGEMYVTGEGVRVELTMSEFSQEREVGLAVTGENGQIWIIHRDAKKAGFLPTRSPTEFESRGSHRHTDIKQTKELLKSEKSSGVLGRKLTTVEHPPSPSTSHTHHMDLEQSLSLHASPGPSGLACHDLRPEARDSQLSYTDTAPNSLPLQANTQQQGSQEDQEEDEAEKEERKEVEAFEEEEEEVMEEEEEEEEDEEEGQQQVEEEAKEEDSEEERMAAVQEEDFSLAEILAYGVSEEEDSINKEETEEDEQSKEEEGGEGETTHYNRASTGQPYNYTKLADLEPGQQKVNVFGVVVDFQRPFQTRGRDFCSIVNIIDETLPKRKNIKFTFFHSNQDRHPRVNKVGDIVIFHRVNMKLFPEGVQGIGQSFSSSLTFPGLLGSKVTPLTGSVSYTFTPDDGKRVRELRLWYAKLSQISTPFLRELKDMRVDQVSTDVVCQVLSVSGQRGETPGPHVAVIRVWDGTCPPHRSLNLDLTMFETRHISDPRMMAFLDKFSQSVVVYGEELVNSVAKITPGQFVYLQHLQAKVHKGQYNCFKDRFDSIELRLQPTKKRETKINILSPESIEVHELGKRLEKCKRGSRSHFRPLPPDIVPAPLTTTLCPKNQVPVPLCSLRGLKPAPRKFLCTVKVLGIEPRSVEQLVLLRCPECKTKKEITPDSTSNPPCPNCSITGKKKRKQKPTLKPTYFFRLILADETGHLVAHVSGKQAEKFLSSCPPTIFYKRPQQRTCLLEKLYTLTGNNDPFDADSVGHRRPWVAVCLLSLPSSVSSDTRSVEDDQNVSYHLFDTVLK